MTTRDRSHLRMTRSPRVEAYKLHPVVIEPKPMDVGDRPRQGAHLGSEQQSKGAIHSDVWTGSAAELASRSAIAIVPKSGWWKAQPARARSEQGVAYSLIVGLELDGEDVDIWTPLSAEVGVEATVIEVEAE